MLSTRLVALLLAFAAFGLADEIVMPPTYTSTDGPTSTALKGGAEFQEVLSGSLFGTLGPISITSVSVRPDLANLYFTGGSATVSITLSTTTRNPDGGLSTTFADNVGTNLATVFTPQLVSFTTANTGVFDMTFTFGAPYTYDPSSGLNLVFDITTDGPVTDGSHYLRLDSAFNIPSGSGVGSVLGPAGALSGGVFNGGLIGQFTYTPVPVPEPTTLGLIGMGLLTVVGYARRRR
jgi:hypothetical protein